MRTITVLLCLAMAMPSAADERQDLYFDIASLQVAPQLCPTPPADAHDVAQLVRMLKIVDPGEVEVTLFSMQQAFIDMARQMPADQVFQFCDNSAALARDLGLD